MSILCVSTLYINNHRNYDIVLYALISEFVTLCVKNHMTAKVLKFKDFYEVSLCSNIIVSTWHERIGSTSNPSLGMRKLIDCHFAISFVYGNISTQNLFLFILYYTVPTLS